jgi:glycosyltransferase involved in cell wall biosynthesis
MVDDASVDRGLISYEINFYWSLFNILDYLKDTLEVFIKDLPIPVRVLRNKNRLGLIKSRLRGAEIAKGDTLTFLDAHIECSPGWLQYLLYEVKKDRYVSIKQYCFF